LRVQATSDDPSATLTVVGFGDMKIKGDGTFHFRAKVGTDPGTITVASSSGGSATTPVTLK